VSAFHFKGFNGGESNFLHYKQIIQEVNYLFIILNFLEFHFKQFNGGESNFLFCKQIIQDTNSLFIILNVSFPFWELGAVASNTSTQQHTNTTTQLNNNITLHHCNLVRCIFCQPIT
jgi:hypothetical protein